MILNSIRWRFQLWHGLILLAVLAGFGFTAYRLQYANELHRVDQGLKQRLGPMLETLAAPPPIGRGNPPGPPPGRTEEGLPTARVFFMPPERAALFAGENSKFYYIIWAPDGSELSRSISAPVDITRPVRPGGIESPPTTRMRGTIREVYRYTLPGECVLVGRSIVPELVALEQFAFWLLGLGGTVLGLGLVGGWWLANRAIRPIKDISAAAARIATGDLSHRISVVGTDNELGQLAGILNQTFACLEAAFIRQQQFTADASHELRTPLAVILTQTQATLARERSPAEYCEALEACGRAARRMRALTESLLVLARLDAGQEPLKHEHFDLGQTVRDCLEMLRPLAEKRGATFQCDCAVAECMGDSESIAQVITNLATNAIIHNPTGGVVCITTRREETAIVLLVADNGPGIPEEDLPRIFERFYRVDKSRTGGSKGAGLGLAICRSIVHAHGGEISVASLPSAGTTFTVRLPLA